MYEKPENISVELINIATHLAVAAIGQCKPYRRLSSIDIKHIITACSDCIYEQFDTIRDSVDDHSTAENTELLEVKMNLLKLAARETATILERVNSQAENDEELIAIVTNVLKECVEAISQQYENFQSAYFERHPNRRPHGPRRVMKF